MDLPGIYSLRPYTQEEIVSRDYILNQKPDGIINIVDATNIERNLYLTLQLLELRVPMVLALNMMDEVRANGGAVDVQRMSRELGIPVVPISAAKGEGVSELVDQALAAARGRVLPKVTDFCADDSAVHRCIHAVVHLIADHADRIGVPARFCAAKLIEGGDDLADRLALDQNERELLEHCIVQMETETGLDRNAALADMRYSFIENVVSASVVKCRESREHARSVKMDRLLTGRYTAVPVFLGIMLLTFWLTFDVIGQRLSDWLAVGVDALTALVDRGLTAYGINPVVKSLIVDGIFAGVGSVLVFLPIIVTLFFFLSILEDTGYMARVAFVMDKPLRRIGLSGRSIVPMLIGFGCSVPAIMATRTVSSDRDRKMTILLTPYMSCSAKISIYAFFTAAFFPRYRALVMIGLYVLGILIGIAAALIMNKTAFRGKPVPFVMELPNYRLPSVKSVALLLWEKAKDSHLVPPELRHPAQRGVRQRRQPAGPDRPGAGPPLRSPGLRRLALRHLADLRLHRQGIRGQHPGGAAGRNRHLRPVHHPVRPELPGVHPAVYPLRGGGGHHPPGAGLLPENPGRGGHAVRRGLAGLPGHVRHRGAILRLSQKGIALLEQQKNPRLPGSRGFLMRFYAPKGFSTSRRWWQRPCRRRCTGWPGRAWPRDASASRAAG